MTAERLTRSTRNNIHQLIRNRRLPTTIVLHLQRVDHIPSVLRGVVHSISPAVNLGGVRLDKDSIDGVGQSELSEVFGRVVLHLVGLEVR